MGGGGKGHGGYPGGGKGSGGKGKGGGKAKGRGFGAGEGNCDDIPEARREDLRQQTEAFARSLDSQMTWPTSVNGLERKFLHVLAEEFGFSSQSFGEGSGNRYICFFKQDHATPKQEKPEESTVTKEANNSELSTGDFVMVSRAMPSKPPDTVTYSAVVLDEESCTRLQKESVNLFSGGFSKGWTVHCDHMTICNGPLANPSTEDFRSVADTFRKSTAALNEGAELNLKVVSTAATDKVLAVGVLGCVSCNRNPHITIATAPGAKPVESNSIRQWTMLPEKKQFSIHGMIWQCNTTRGRAPPAWAWASHQPSAETFKPNASQIEEQANNAVVRMSSAFLQQQHGGLPASSTALLSVLRRKYMVTNMYVIHPLGLAGALAATEDISDEALETLQLMLQGPCVDPLELFKQVPNCVPADVVRRAKRLYSKCNEDGGPGQRARWIISQAYVPAIIDMDTVLQGLVERGDVELLDNGKVRYHVSGNQSVKDLKAGIAYVEQWPVKQPRKTPEKWEVMLGGNWGPIDDPTTQRINNAIKKGETKVNYSARGQSYIIDLIGMVQTNDATGKSRNIRRAE